MTVDNSSSLNFGRVDQRKPADQLFREMVENVMTTRHELLHKLMDPRRNIDDECGHPIAEEITADLYQNLYNRHPIANRVVSLFPSECWKIQPTIYESEDSEEQTEFEVVWDGLGKSLAGTGWYKSEEGSSIWEYLQRIDAMAGIGSFGLLLLGIDDGKPLNEPVAGISDKGIAEGGSVKQRRKLLYLRTFDESLIQVTRYETDVTNPRFGQPIEYLINFQDPTQQTHGGIGTQVATKPVHWSRVIHVADNLTSNETFGVPRMLPVLNPILDLAKLYGGSAEMYWRGAFPGFSLETNPQLGGDVEVDADDLKDQMEQYMNGLQRYMALMGMTAKSLAPQVVDPVSQIQVQIEAICIELAIPVRIFMGSERGELASSQDADTWEGRLQNRRTRFITPKIIAPFVDRLIAMGVLPEPKEYFVSWDKADTLTKVEQINVAAAQTSAIAQYVSSGAEALLSPLDFLTRLLGIEEEEAQAILETAAESYEEAHPEPDPSQLPPGEQVGTGGETGAKPGAKPETKKEGPPVNPKLASKQGAVKNVFCPTGEGGGIDPTCEKEGGSVASDVASSGLPSHGRDYSQYKQETRVIDGKEVQGHMHGSAYGDGGWVANTADVHPDAEVSKGAQILDKAVVHPNVFVAPGATIAGNAQVGDPDKEGLSPSSSVAVSKNAIIKDNAVVKGQVFLEPSAIVAGNAQLEGDSAGGGINIGAYQTVTGTAKLSGSVQIPYEDNSEPLVIDSGEVEGRTVLKGSEANYVAYEGARGKVYEEVKGQSYRVKRRIAKDLGAGLASGGLDKEAARELVEGLGHVTGPEADAHYAAADRVVRQWASTSGDHDYRAIAVQETVAKVFGLQEAADPRQTYYGGSTSVVKEIRDHDLGKIDAFKQKHEKALSAISQETYKQTQAMFKKIGVKELTVYRGMEDVSIGDKVQLNPLSSFATNKGEARSFGDTVIKMKVPVDRIYSTSITGPGCYDEDEVIVLGGVYPCEVIYGVPAKNQ